MRVLQIATLLMVTGALGAPKQPRSPCGTVDDPETSASINSALPSDTSSSLPDQTAPGVYNEPPRGGDGLSRKNRNGTYTNTLYFTNWGIYTAKYQPNQIPAKEITHLLYAFPDMAENGTVYSSDPWADVQIQFNTSNSVSSGNNAYGCVGEIFRLKKQNRNMKVLLSIGGWNHRDAFAPIAATETGRHTFARSAVKLVTDWGFDGIDVDWEYPADTAQGANFVLLLKACRDELDRYAAEHRLNYRFTLTVATSAGEANYKSLDFKGMDDVIDTWYLMAYDYAGSWDKTSGHQSALHADKTNPEATKFNTEDAVKAYLQKGVPADKISLGMPLYGRSFMGTKGIGMPYSAAGDGSNGEGTWLYKDLPRPGATEFWDPVVVAAYSLDNSTGELVTYDTVKSTEVKMEWVKDNGLAGAMFWEASGDKTGTDSLVGKVSDILPLDQTQNLLEYPTSIYDNIRSGSDNGDSFGSGSNSTTF